MAKAKISLRSTTERLINWVTENRTETLILFGILLIASFLRLYRINEYMTFLGDEGRDAVIVRRFLVDGDIMLVGPGTSIGNMYLGPLYYYFIAPALLLAGFSPVGPSILIALVGVATIFLVWTTLKLWLKKSELSSFAVSFLATSAAIIYAVSPTTIIFSRSSWNPNIMPFFALLSLLCVERARTTKNYLWLIILGVSYAFVLQSHYLGLLLLPVIFLGVLGHLRHLGGLGRRRFIRYLVIGGLAFSLLMSPLVAFDARHGFRNFKAMQTFLGEGDGSFKGIPEAISHASNVYTNMFVRLPGMRDGGLGKVLAVGALVAVLFLALKRRINVYIRYVLLWIFFGVVGLAFVEREIYDHYMGFLFPAPYMLLALIAGQLLTIKSNALYKGVSFLIFLGVVLCVLAGFSNSPLKDNPSRQLYRAKIVADKVLAEAGGKVFNLAVLAETNYEDGYRYFLETGGATILHADIWDKATISDTLIVICERPYEECHPTTNPKAEVANFGMSKIEAEWQVVGVNIFKLSHKN